MELTELRARIDRLAEDVHATSAETERVCSTPQKWPASSGLNGALFTPRELAQLTGYTPSAIGGLISNGTIAPAAYSCGDRLFDAVALDVLLERRRQHLRAARTEEVSVYDN